MTKSNRETILSADIGGTNTRFLLYEVRVTEELVNLPLQSTTDIPGELILNKKYQNQDFESFIDVLKQFLQDANASSPPLTACFAVAGPVKDNVVRFTNRASWSIDGDFISKELGISCVKLINDFLAVGYGILTLNESTECIVLQHGHKQPNAPIACIGAGTGLGECFLTPNSSDGVYQCFPSEGGHSEFAPRNDLEVGLLNHLKRKFVQKHRVSVERVVSGTGLVNIYEYLCQTYPELVDATLHDKINSAGDLKGALIATNQWNQICFKTMEIFITAYGAEAGVAALKWLPYGGLYLTGGLTPKNIDLIRSSDGPFMSAFLDKGRVSGMLCSIPVFAVMVEDLGERGAHYMGFKLMQELKKKEIATLKETESQSSSSPLKLYTNKNNVDSISKYIWPTIYASTGFLLALLITSRRK